MKPETFDFEKLKKCIDIYLETAFPDGVPEDCFNAGLIKRVKAEKDFDGLFGCFKKEEPETGKIKYSLQLGSYKYPYIKIALMKSDSGEYGFLVDRHTEYMKAYSDSQYFERELEIKDYTKDLKTNVEQKWDENGIATYRELVRKQTELETKKKRDLIISKLGYSILLVEDDLDIGKLHKLKLELLGYDVFHAENGEIALLHLESRKFDIMLLDLMMPSISGFEVIKRVSNVIPIIVLSAISDKMTIESCLNDGAVAFIIKPVTSEVLKDTLNSVIKNHIPR